MADDPVKTLPPAAIAASAPNAEKSQIPGIIEAYTRRIRSISRCAREYVPLAQSTSQRWIANSNEIMTSLLPLIQSDPQKGALEFARRVSRDDIQYHVVDPHSELLSQGILILGFSAFDAFVGAFITRLYSEERSLLYKLEEKELKINELLGCKDIDDAIKKLIERDVSNLLRDNYNDLFSTLASRHGLATITKFPNWPRFIEAAQRRNLITHCDGVINSQYLGVCKKCGMELPPEAISGCQLKVNAEYLQAALDILYEVGVKLGHTLWRTASQANIGHSEKILTDEVFNLLTREEWSLARVIGEFAVNIPHPKVELQNRISRINYAQALKWSGDQVGALKVVDAVDWSGSIRDLRLGVAVLRDDYDNAGKLMREIGKKGEIVCEEGYREWPVFREFRKSGQFACAFLEIYGKPFDTPDSSVPHLPPADPVVQLPRESQSDHSNPTTGESTMPSSQPIDPDPKDPLENSPTS